MTDTFHHLGADADAAPVDDAVAAVADRLGELHIPVPQPVELEPVEADEPASPPAIAPGALFGRELYAPVEVPEPTAVFAPLPPVADVERVSQPISGVNPKDLLGALKPDLSLVPPAALLHTASAMMDGAAKYGPYNWRENAVQARVYVAAAMRHLQQFLDGEDIDPISGVHHLGHASACCAILLDARETGNLADNRPLPGAAGDMIRRWSSDTKFG